jgi:hypothetical protein
VPTRSSMSSRCRCPNAGNLRARREIRASGRSLIRRDDVIPLAVNSSREMLMPFISRSLTFTPLGYWFVSSSALLSRGRADQLHDYLMADQRLASPVLRDESEQSMLDFVPLAGAGRQVSSPRSCTISASNCSGCRSTHSRRMRRRVWTD